MIKPEKYVEHKILAMCFQLGWSVEVFDSKATYSVASGGYKRNQGLVVGCPDLIGCDDKGHFVALELKADGKATVCSFEQHQFLKRKIEHGAFGIVTSCPEFLKSTYQTWLGLSPSERKSYLIGLLPTKVQIQNGKSKKIITIQP